MSEIFDFTKIRKLVEKNHSEAIIIVDTNVVMNNPDFSKWQTDLKEPIFVIPNIVVDELKDIIDNPKKNKEDRAKAKTADDAYLNLMKDGVISEGIPKKNVGWLISLPSPTKSYWFQAFNEPLFTGKYDFERDTIGKVDAKLLITYSKCRSYFRNVKNFLITSDKRMARVGNVTGRRILYTAWLHDSPVPKGQEHSFPFDFKGFLMRSYDILKTADDILEDTKGKGIKVDLTMLGKRYDPGWQIIDEEGKLHVTGVVLIDGDGVIHLSDNHDVYFRWRLPQLSLVSKEILQTQPLGGEPGNDLDNSFIGPCIPGNDEDDIFRVTLDFKGPMNPISDHLISILSDTIREIISADLKGDLPTVQSSLCVVEEWIRNRMAGEYILQYKAAERKNISDKELNALLDYALEQSGNIQGHRGSGKHLFKDFDELIDRCTKYLRKCSNEELIEFIKNITSIWNVGHKVTITLPSDRYYDEPGSGIRFSLTDGKGNIID